MLARLHTASLAPQVAPSDGLPSTRFTASKGIAESTIPAPTPSLATTTSTPSKIPTTEDLSSLKPKQKLTAVSAALCATSIAAAIAVLFLLYRWDRKRRRHRLLDKDVRELVRSRDHRKNVENGSHRSRNRMKEQGTTRPAAPQHHRQPSPRGLSRSHHHQPRTASNPASMSVREVHRATTSPTAWAPATALPSFPVSGFDVTGAQQPFAFGNPITATQRHRVSQSMPATPTADTFDGFSIIPLGPKSIKSNTFSVVGANPCHLEEGVSPLCASFSITSLIGRSMLDLNTESSTSLASPTWFNEADWYGGIGNGSDLYLEEGGLKVDEGLKGAFGFCD